MRSALFSAVEHEYQVFVLKLRRQRGPSGSEEENGNQRGETTAVKGLKIRSHDCEWRAKRQMDEN